MFTPEFLNVFLDSVVGSEFQVVPVNESNLYRISSSPHQPKSQSDQDSSSNIDENLPNVKQDKYSSQSSADSAKHHCFIIEQIKKHEGAPFELFLDILYIEFGESRLTRKCFNSVDLNILRTWIKSEYHFDLIDLDNGSRTQTVDSPIGPPSPIRVIPRTKEEFGTLNEKDRLGSHSTLWGRTTKAAIESNLFGIFSFRSPTADNPKPKGTDTKPTSFKNPLIANKRELTDFMSPIPSDITDMEFYELQLAITQLYNWMQIIFTFCIECKRVSWVNTEIIHLTTECQKVIFKWLALEAEHDGFAFKGCKGWSIAMIEIKEQANNLYRLHSSLTYENKTTGTDFKDDGFLEISSSNNQRRKDEGENSTMLNSPNDYATMKIQNGVMDVKEFKKCIRAQVEEEVLVEKEEELKSKIRNEVEKRIYDEQKNIQRNYQEETERSLREILEKEYKMKLHKNIKEKIHELQAQFDPDSFEKKDIKIKEHEEEIDSIKRNNQKIASSTPEEPKKAVIQEEDLESLLIQNEDLKEKAKKLEETYCKVLNESNDKQKLHIQEMRELDTKISLSSETISELKKQIQTLSQEKISLENRCKELACIKLVESKKISEFENEVNKLTRHITSIEKENQQLKELNNIQNENNSQTGFHWCDKSSQKKYTLAESKEQTKKTHQLGIHGISEAENSKLAQISANKNGTIESFQNQLKEIKIKYATLGNQNLQSKQLIEDLTKEKVKLEKKLEKAEQSTQSRTSVTLDAGRKKKSGGETENFGPEVKELIVSKSKVEKEVDSLKRKVTNLQSKYENDIEAHKKLLKESRKSLEETITERNVLNKEIIEIRKKHSETTTEQGSRIKQLEELINEKSEELKTQKKDCSELKKTLALKMDNLSKLKEDSKLQQFELQKHVNKAEEVGMKLQMYNAIMEEKITLDNYVSQINLGIAKLKKSVDIKTDGEDFGLITLEILERIETLKVENITSRKQISTFEATLKDLDDTSQQVAEILKHQLPDRYAKENQKPGTKVKDTRFQFEESGRALKGAQKSDDGTLAYIIPSSDSDLSLGAKLSLIVNEAEQVIINLKCKESEINKLHSQISKLEEVLKNNDLVNDTKLKQSELIQKDLKFKNAELVKQVTLLKNQAENKSNDEQVLNDMKSQIEVAHISIYELNTKFTKCNNELNQTKSELELKSKKILLLTEDLESKQIESTTFKESAKVLQGIIDKLSTEVDKSVKQLNDTQNENKQLQIRLDSLEQDRVKYQKEITNLQKQISIQASEDSHANLEELIRRYDVVDNERKKFQDQLGKAQEEIQTLLAYRDSIEQEKMKCDELKMVIKDLQDELYLNKEQDEQIIQELRCELSLAKETVTKAKAGDEFGGYLEGQIMIEVLRRLRHAPLDS